MADHPRGVSRHGGCGHRRRRPRARRGRPRSRPRASPGLPRGAPEATRRGDAGSGRNGRGLRHLLRPSFLPIGRPGTCDRPFPWAGPELRGGPELRRRSGRHDLPRARGAGALRRSGDGGGLDRARLRCAGIGHLERTAFRGALQPLDPVPRVPAGRGHYRGERGRAAAVLPGAGREVRARGIGRRAGPARAPGGVRGGVRRGGGRVPSLPSRPPDGLRAHRRDLDRARAAGLGYRTDRDPGRRTRVRRHLPNVPGGPASTATPRLRWRPAKDTGAAGAVLNERAARKADLKILFAGAAVAVLLWAIALANATGGVRTPLGPSEGGGWSPALDFLVLGAIVVMLPYGVARTVHLRRVDAVERRLPEFLED